jgi:hypothetical protein
VIFLVVNFCHFVKKILRKEYSVENSLFLGEYLAKKGKILPELPNCLQYEGVLQIFGFHILNILKFD